MLFTLSKSSYPCFPAFPPSWLAKHQEEKQPILLAAEPNFTPLRSGIKGMSSPADPAQKRGSAPSAHRLELPLTKPNSDDTSS